MNYRSHPKLVEVLSAAAYGGIVECQPDRPRFDQWARLNFPDQYQMIPLLFLQVSGTEEQSGTRSWLNRDQSDTACQTYFYIKKCCPFSSVVVLSYYAANVEDVKEIDEAIEAFTVNEFQGREADFVILITTRTMATAQHGRELYTFVLDEQRTTVALSRAKQGMVIIGDADVLQSAPIWERYLAYFSDIAVPLSTFKWWIGKRRQENRRTSRPSNRTKYIRAGPQPTGRCPHHD